DEGAMFSSGPIVVGHGSPSFLRHLRNRQVDSVISAAAANVATQAVTNFFGSRIRMLIQDRLERHNESRRAKAALRSVVIAQGLLNETEVVALHQFLNGCIRL